MAGEPSFEPAASREPPVGGLREGLGLFGEGARLLRRQRRLWPLAAVPVLFALLFLTGAVALFAASVDLVHAALTGWLPQLEAGAWWTWLWVGPVLALFWVLGWLAVAIAFVVSLVAALLLANLAAAPFLDVLSQRVEEIVTGRREEAEGSVALLREILRSFGAELARLAFLAGLWLVISLVGLIVPGAQLVTGPLLVIVTVLFLPLDYAGFALDRRQVSFRARRRWLLEHWPVMVGFGGIGLLASGVPGLNLMVMPVMVTAGTLLVLRRPLPVGSGASAPELSDRGSG